MHTRCGCPLPIAGLSACLILLAGCSSIAPDSGLESVQRLARERLGAEVLRSAGDSHSHRSEDRIAALLARPLSADGAVQLTLLNNRGLQARLHELGIAQADLLQASMLPNPGVSFSRLRQGSEVEIERGLHFSLARLLALPWIQRLESQRFEQAQGSAALAVLNLAADTRRSYIQALAAQESLTYLRQVMQAAQAGAELARRMEQVGNFSKLQRAREQAFYADAALDLAQAQAQAARWRERLVRLLGLWGEDVARLQLPARLPDLPAQLAQRPDAERSALAQRLDVLGATRQVQITAEQLGLSQRTRFINVLDLGRRHNSLANPPAQSGWEVTLELPLFDWGTARVARAEHVYMQALHDAADTAINARSEVREAYAALHSAWDVARHHRQEIVPLRQRIAEENLLRYNGMLIGVFELLADARVQITSVHAAIQALRDYWLAQAEMDMAMIGKPSLLPGPNAAAAAAAPAMAAH